eukprot:Hpha_TRINITY_DN4225_c0_g1::TRINITY_DN4225_c0_g1_i1::g.186589::m.186589/K03355/APC8, CDC23; anaphase-promoting complex subunit 8
MVMPAMPPQLSRLEELEAAYEEAVLHCMEDDAVWLAEMMELPPASAAAKQHFVGTLPPTTCQGPAEADLARQVACFIELQEPARAADFLRRGDWGSESEALMTFLYAWSLHLKGEQERRDLCLDKGTLLSPKPVQNTADDSAFSLLQLRRNKLHAQGLWLFAALLHKRGNDQEAKNLLIDAVTRRPLLWSAWKLLADIASLRDFPVIRAHFAQFGGHWVICVFEALLNSKCHDSDSAMVQYRALSAELPAAPIMGGFGSACYDAGDLETAERVFETLREKEPHRVEDLEKLTMLLYTQGRVSSLALLAHQCNASARSHKATQYVLGNLYSLDKCSSKAIAYFHRALQLDPDNASAWTLLGHEYSPYQAGVTNTRACMYAYHRAVLADPREYRAWLGLAQIAYSEFSLPFLAAYYAGRCLAVRPNDERVQKVAEMIREEAQSRCPGGSEWSPFSRSPFSANQLNFPAS